MVYCRKKFVSLQFDSDGKSDIDHVNEKINGRLRTLAENQQELVVLERESSQLLVSLLKLD